MALILDPTDKITMDNHHVKCDRDNSRFFVCRGVEATKTGFDSGCEKFKKTEFGRRVIAKFEMLQNKIINTSVYQTISEPVSGFYEGHKRAVKDAGVCFAA